MADSLSSAEGWVFNGQQLSFLDRVYIDSPGKSGRGEYRVRGSEPFLQGHFPGDPLVPGVVLVEIVAQLSRLVVESRPNGYRSTKLRLSILRSVKILASARPNELIQIQVSVTAPAAGLVQVQGRVFVASRELLSAEMAFTEIPKENDRPCS